MTVNKTDHISFFVPGLPIAQPRAHQSSSGGRIRRFVPSAHPIHGYRLSIQAEFLRLGFGEPWLGPIMMFVEFWMPRPKSITSKKRRNFSRPHDKKPDLSNLLKGVEDAVNGLLYRDDSQVWRIDATKRYCGYDNPVGTTIQAFRVIPDEITEGNKQ